MCGIVGYVGHRRAWPIIIQGLRSLEYRGYDSAGIAVVTPSGELEVQKTVGKVRELDSLTGGKTPGGNIGVGHTRWATHGQPNFPNSHPHTDCQRRLAVVHNGIVENYQELKGQLISRGHHFASDTDTEVIPHLIEEYVDQGMNLESALLRTASLLRGANVIGVLSRSEPNKLLALRMGYAGGTVVAHRQGEAMFASDLPALVPFASKVWFVEDGQMAVVTPQTVDIFRLEGGRVQSHPTNLSKETSWVDKGGHEHFMLKEILEEPQALSSALRGRVSFEEGRVHLEELTFSEEELSQLQKVVLIGCGTSLHACMIGRYLIEDLAGLPATWESSSEFRYRPSQIDGRTLVVAVGQSGETADTLAAMQEARQRGGRLVTICNIEGSQATRLAESSLYMKSGLEIGVASTKTFVASLAILSLLATYLGQLNGRLDPLRRKQVLADLAAAPNLMGRALAHHEPYRDLARRYARFNHFLYLGRGLTYPVAVEGALKLKEVSYIHAEGYPAGEMKHGPIALIDGGMPTLAIATAGPLYDKMTSNIKEVKARGGTVIAVATEGDDRITSEVDDVVYVPPCSEELSPILTVLPLQMFAYYVALRRDCDVDQPRNLAKSVTVE